MPDCVYNARDPRYMSKPGAVPAGEELHFAITLGRQIRCTAAYLLIRADSQAGEQQIPMYWSGMNGPEGEWWSVGYAAPTPGLYWYRFEYDTPWGRGRIQCGVRETGTAEGDALFQLTVFDPRFHTPDFLKGGVMYQIFPDRFYSSGTPKQNVPSDRILRTDYENLPEYRPDAQGIVRNNDYFGGDLKGVEEKLDYLKSLGVTCLYLNPIFEAHSNHRYNTADYTKIDPLLGTQEDFESLCRAAHARGISILLDGVFSHTGSDSVYFNREGRYGPGGAYRDANSPYRQWYDFKSWPNDYASWWGIDTLPQVIEEQPDYLNYIAGPGGVLEKWMRAGADGWRLDVADELPDGFLDALRERVKAVNPQAVVIGEVWEDASNKCSYGQRRRYLLGKQLDSVMNYPFQNAVLDYISTGNADGFCDRILTVLSHYPKPVVDVLMNSIGTHDTARAITALAGEPCGGRGRDWQNEHCFLPPERRAYGVTLLKLAAVLQFTLPGVPCIYYGDEIGMEGYGDPFNRRYYDWAHGDEELRGWYRALGKLRRDHPVLRDGAFVELSSGMGCVAYAREKGEQKLVVIVNRNNSPMDFYFHPQYYGLEKVIGHTPELDRVHLDPLSCAVLASPTPPARL